MASRVSPKVANQLAKATVNGVASKIRKEMRSKAPKDDGTLRKAIKNKRRRGKPDLAVADVRIEHGDGANHDAWYWHIVERGSAKHTAQPFVRPTIDEMVPQIPMIYREEFGKRLEKKLDRMAKK